MILAAHTSRNIQRKAEDLLADNDYDNSLPVPTEKIAEQLGYKITLFVPDEALKEVSGIVDHERKVISLNSQETARRQRFTLAHEIGHIVLHKGQSFVDYRKTINDPTDEKEVEANLFAAELLMPVVPFLRYWIHYKADIPSMSVKFAVHQDAIARRAKELRIP